MQKQNKSNSKKRNTSLTLVKAELLAVTVQKYPCLYGNNSHRPHKEKNVVQNVWEAVVHELDFIAGGTNSIFDACILPISPQCSFSIPWNSKVELSLLMLLTLAITH